MLAALMVMIKGERQAWRKSRTGGAELAVLHSGRLASLAQADSMSPD